MCQDGRVHGFLQFYGAKSDWPVAGHLVQVQNLPRNSMPDLEDIYCASASQMFGVPVVKHGLMVDSGKRVRLLSLH